MAQQALESFQNVVLQDKGLQERLKRATDRESFINLTVELGREKGYSFTADEVRAKLDDPTGAEGELSEAELEAVAGGAASFGSSILCGYCQAGTPGVKSAELDSIR